MCVVDFDPPSFLFTQRRRSRKGFRCAECTVDHPAGTHYQHTTGKWDDYVGSYKRCEACVELARAVDAVDCSWAYDSLLDDAREAVTEHTDATPEAMGRLVALLWLARERLHHAADLRHPELARRARRGAA